MNKDTWICDACGDTIKNESDGWIEWLSRSDSAACHGLRLVHHQPASPRGPSGSCQYDADLVWSRDRLLIHDMQLDAYLGPDGLMQLLTLLSNGKLPPTEVIEMVKRLHIPGYEHGRHHFEQAIEEGLIDPDTKFGFFPQRDIQAALRLAKE